MAASTIVDDVKQAANAEKKLEKILADFEKEVEKDAIIVEKEVVKDVVKIEREVERDVFGRGKAREKIERETVLQ